MIRIAKCHESRGYIRVKKWPNVEKLGNFNGGKTEKLTSREDIQLTETRIFVSPFLLCFSSASLMSRYVDIEVFNCLKCQNFHNCDINQGMSYAIFHFLCFYLFSCHLTAL